MKGNRNSHRARSKKHKLLLLVCIIIGSVVVYFFYHSTGPPSAPPKPHIIRSSTTEKPKPKPTCSDLRIQKGCDDMHVRPVHTPETWAQFRQAYRTAVGLETANARIGSDDMGHANAFRFDVVARQSPGKGRGIFANEDIGQGEILYDFGKTAHFSTGQAFRDFLEELPNTLACDVLMWSYVQYFPDEQVGELNEEYEDFGNYRICTDLDPGSFCNDGGDDEVNMAWEDDQQLYHPAINNHGIKIAAPLRAIRDIKKGEEVMCNYGQFSAGNWAVFGL